MSTKTWGDIIGEEQGKRFVGRVAELARFRQELSRTSPWTLIFYITGQGGVGKTTLLDRYRDIASREYNFLVASSDDQQGDIPKVLGELAHQLRATGHTLKRFEEQYKVYRQHRQEIEADPDAPQGLAAWLGRTVARGGVLAAQLHPFTRKGVELLGHQEIEQQVSEWAAYLAKRIGNKDEVALMRDPVPVLSELFFQDLNDAAAEHRVLLY